MIYAAKINTFPGFPQWGWPGVEQEPGKLWLTVWSCTSFQPEREGGSWRDNGSSGPSPDLWHCHCKQDLTSHHLVWGAPPGPGSQGRGVLGAHAPVTMSPWSSHDQAMLPAPSASSLHDRLAAGLRQPVCHPWQQSTSHSQGRLQPCLQPGTLGCGWGSRNVGWGRPSSWSWAWPSGEETSPAGKLCCSQSRNLLPYLNRQRFCSWCWQHPQQSIFSR